MLASSKQTKQSMPNSPLKKTKFSGVLGRLDEIDRSISQRIADLELGACIELFIVIPTLMFSPIGIPIFIVLSIFWFKSFVFVVSMVLGLIFSEGIKAMSCRPRPSLQAHKPLNITQHLMKIDSFSMPSGDALQSAVFAVVVAYHLQLTQLAYILIPWAAFGRVYWGNHWIGDTVVGAFIGSFVSFVICFNFDSILIHNLF
mmetsp:Transcript_43374/g.71659  ORF Transcript_43374/g.71659 Transcript_43374/m.71659 type:complete len:201 (-) Transcript_43374:26-628(-)